MLVLVFAAIIMFWLIVGAIQFLVCVTYPRLRRYALSAAFWWALWGPCSVALLSLAGFAIVANIFIAKDGDVTHFKQPHLLQYLGWGYLILGLFFTILTATVVSYLHQAVIRRLPFLLFRGYSTIVVGGIGSVFGWCLSWMFLVNDIRFPLIGSIAAMLFLIGGFGAAAYRWAAALHGDAQVGLSASNKLEE